MKKENEFLDHFDNLFDIAHSNTINMVDNDVDKQFLNCQRQNGRPGLLTGIDRTSYRKEKKNIYDLKKLKKEKKHAHCAIQETCEYLENLYLNISLVFI